MYEINAQKSGKNVRRTAPTPNVIQNQDSDLLSYLMTMKGTSSSSTLPSGSSSSSTYNSSDEIPIELTRYFSHDLLSMLDEDEKYNFDILKW